MRPILAIQNLPVKFWLGGKKLSVRSRHYENGSICGAESQGTSSDLSTSRADQEFRHLTIADAVRCIAPYDLDDRTQSGKLFHLLPAFGLPSGHQTLSLADRYNAKNAVYFWASAQMEREARMKYRHENESAVLDFITTLNNSPYRPWEGVGRENT